MENGGECAALRSCVIICDSLSTFVSFSTHYTRALVLGVKTGNWHVFPIDNPTAWARMAIAGARAVSSPPRLNAREP